MPDTHLADDCLDSPVEVRVPRTQRLPIVLASPHSGRCYPQELIDSSRLDPHALRRSEDSFVDEIFAHAAEAGAPLICATFARAYLDMNREAYELDPRMFDDKLPAYVNTQSTRVACGLGTIARVVAHGQEIYARKLKFAEAVERVNRCYRPYHAALRRLIDQTVRQFGFCILLDCHSMPSLGGDAPESRVPVDFVLGDCHGKTCVPAVVDVAERQLTSLGFATARNTPYAGGYTTRHYGRPDLGVHALQIEINRALYMDEKLLTPKPFLSTLAGHMASLVERLGRLPLASLHKA